MLACLALAAPAVVRAAPCIPVITAAITPNASIALPGQTVNFTISYTNTCMALASTLDFGDGNMMVLGPPYPKSVSHVYAQPGTENLTLSIVIVNAVIIARTTVTIANPAMFSLTAAPTSVIAGQAVNFTASTGRTAIPGAYVDFGDGSLQVLSAPTQVLIHHYNNPSLYTARLLITGQGVSYAQAQVNVALNPVQVPIGQVYSSFLVGSPVLAGTDTSIALTYRIITPYIAGSGGVSPLQVIVELADRKGHVVQRSDPFVPPYNPNAPNDVQTVLIPYTVPADAGGDYLVRLYVRVDQGGTVAVGRALPLQIIGGPDPAPIVNNQFHASGAVLTNSGTNRGGYNVNLGLTTALQWSSDEVLLTGLFDPVSKKVDPLFTFQSATPAPVTAPNATPAPNSSTTSADSGTVTPPPTNTGTPIPNAAAPVPSPQPGHTVGPTPPGSGTPTAAPQPTPKTALTDLEMAALTVADAAASPAPQPQPQTGAPAPAGATPAAVPAPAPAPAPAPTPTPQPPLQFKDVIGRTDASLPAVIGNKETLRGLDLTYGLPSGWTLHGGGGYFQLPSNSTTERSGELFDFTKGWAGNTDTFRIAYSRNQDDVNKFVSTGTTGPLDVTAGVFEWNEGLTPHLKALLTGGISSTQPLSGGGAAYADDVDKADLNYSVGATTLDVEYHNAAAQFGTLSGASALSDRAGGAGSLSFMTSPISTLALTYGRDNVRSVFSSTSATALNFSITPPKYPGITFGLERDAALAPGADTVTNTINLGLSKTGPSSLTLTGTIASADDSLQPSTSSTTRTGVLNYQFTNGPHNFGAGLNATSTTSASSSAGVSEAVNYGFTFGGRVPPNTMGTLAAPTRNFEVKFVLTNANMRAQTSGSHTGLLTGLLSYHLTPQLAPGVEFNYQKHYDQDPAMDATTSLFRFRLDVNM
jgi:hypothetical protein